MEDIEYSVMAAVEEQHWWYVGMRQIAQAWLDQLPTQRAWRALDAGCGTAGNVAYLLGDYGPAYGLDLMQAAVQLGRKKTDAPLTQGSVLTLPYRDESFDLVTSFEVLYHRAVPDEVAALQEIYRVLKPGGWVLLRMPAYHWLYSAHDRSVHTRRRYTNKEVQKLLRAANFTIERSSYINSMLFPLILLQRLIERIRPSAPTNESAMQLPGRLANKLFGTARRFEARWLESGSSFPFGLSILTLAQKPNHSV